MNPLERLKAIMPPPSHPTAATGDWAEAERQLGTALPQDYKDYISTYGVGLVCGELWINSPFAVGDEYNLRAIATLNINNLKDFADQGLLVDPPPLFPDAGGLLPFGSTKNAHYLTWKTAGSPDAWPVVVWDNGYTEFRETQAPLTMTEFIAGLLDGTSEFFAIGMFTIFKSCKPQFAVIDPVKQAFPNAP